MIYVFLLQKLQERKNMFEVGSYKDDSEKEKWQLIIAMDFMSSDESCTEEGSDVLVSKPLSWRSACVKTPLMTLHSTRSLPLPKGK